MIVIIVTICLLINGMLWPFPYTLHESIDYLIYYRCRSVQLGGLTKLRDTLPFTTLCYMIEEPMNEGSLLILAETGLFRTTLFGDVEELMIWPTTLK